jgi:AcrR family transcriptional regulator
MVRPSCRELILDAAEAVVAAAGAGHLTLDAVAEAAQVSKGGLLYHFPSKSALLEAMLERLVAGYESRCAAYEAQFADDPDPRFRAEMAAGLEKREQDAQVGAAILAAVANEPALLDRCRAFHAARYLRYDPAKPEEARKLLLLLAIDGLHLLELLQLAPFSAEQGMALRAQVLGVAAGDCGH